MTIVVVNPVPTPTSSSQSKVTLQQIVNIAQTFGDIEPVLNVAGSSAQPALTIANDVMNAMCGVPFPQKWNEIVLPQFYTNSWQQDYAVVYPSGASLTNLAWLERGTAIDINNTAIPKPFRYVETGRQLPQATGTYWNSATNDPLFLVNFFPNNTLYYGTWGQGNLGSNTFGNNPYPGAIYTSPLGAYVTAASWSGGQITFTLNYIPNGIQAGAILIVSGAYPVGYNSSFTVVSVSGLTVLVTSTANPGTYQAGGLIGNNTNINQPVNPISQIQDSNGNLLVLTTYGTEGTTPPTAAANATPGTVVSGTGATTKWTVADPFGQGFRILPIPSETGVVWQFNLVGQMTPVRFTSLTQTLFPLPDQFEPNFRAGFISQCYRYSPESKVRAKFKDEWTLWLASLNELRSKQDRETEENRFVPERGIMSNGWGYGNRFGPQNPFNTY